MYKNCIRAGYLFRFQNNYQFFFNVKTLFIFSHSSLPTFDSKMKESVDKDIDSAKEWIKEYL